jgi:hypothetical protein
VLDRHVQAKSPAAAAGGRRCSGQRLLEKWLGGRAATEFGRKKGILGCRKPRKGSGEGTGGLGLSVSDKNVDGGWTETGVLT